RRRARARRAGRARPRRTRRDRGSRSRDSRRSRSPTRSWRRQLEHEELALRLPVIERQALPRWRQTAHVGDLLARRAPLTELLARTVDPEPQYGVDAVDTDSGRVEVIDITGPDHASDHVTEAVAESKRPGFSAIERDEVILALEYLDRDCATAVR